MTSSTASSSQAGPSTRRIDSTRSGDIGSPSSSNIVAKPQPSGNIAGDSAQDDDEVEDERMDLSTLQGFARNIQRDPEAGDADQLEFSSIRNKVVIPKRGEKDFEPLAETVNLQEMMLQRSREALFSALNGVRGSNSKSMSHALLTPQSPYPRILITRGHLLDSMGISVRDSSHPGGKTRTYTELLPEEALYLLERGSLQIWAGPTATEDNDEPDIGEWSEDICGVKGAVELSVMEGFGTFIGKDDLTWERYQSYAYLKRLGYTVQRTRRFIPPHFLLSTSASAFHSPEEHDPTLPPFTTWWRSIPNWIYRSLKQSMSRLISMRAAVGSLGLKLALPFAVKGKRSDFSVLGAYGGIKDYRSLFTQLVLTPNTHAPQHLVRGSSSQIVNSQEKSTVNPYTPFWHVWKPATSWSKANWEKGSDEGLKRQPPEYHVAVVNARTTPLPSKTQLSEIFEALPDEPKGPTKKLGPQYEKKVNRTPSVPAQSLDSFTDKLLSLLGRKPVPASPRPTAGNPMGALRNGDRALVVAVNDSGNTGWVRFGRSTFAEAIFP